MGFCTDVNMVCDFWFFLRLFGPKIVLLKKVKEKGCRTSGAPWYVGLYIKNNLPSIISIPEMIFPFP